MAFNALQFRYIRFLGPDKEPAEFTFTPGLNILWGSSDTGKTFLVQAMDFMLGGGTKPKDIPERVGYDRILLGIACRTFSLLAVLAMAAVFAQVALIPSVKPKVKLLPISIPTSGMRRKLAPTADGLQKALCLHTDRVFS